MIEEWKDITGYEGVYQVSNLGRVKSLSRVTIHKSGKYYRQKEKILSINYSGKYKIPLVHLYDQESDCTRGRKAIGVHRLVALAFIPNPENKPDVNHIDGDRRNNHVSNLEWTTRLENMQHGFRTGLINNTGTNHGNNIYTDEQIKQVKLLLKTTNLTYKQIQGKTGVKLGTIQQIKLGNQWRHIDV